MVAYGAILGGKGGPGVNLSVSINPKDIAYLHGVFGTQFPRALERSILRAVNSVCDRLFARVKREVYAETQIKPGLIGKMMKKYKATFGRGADRVKRFKARVWLGGRDLDLMKLGPIEVNPRGKKGNRFAKGRGEGGGVQFKSPIGRGKTFIPHAFLQTMKGGGSPHVFLRAKSIDEWASHSKRLPIYKQGIKSPVAGVYLRNPAKLNALHAFADAELRKQILTQSALVKASLMRRVA
jgi:hypothetical protein